MTQAKITINAVIGSNTDLPIDTIVQLNNVNVGGELTFFWEILDQPPGPADTLSNPAIQNPTFTPKKEGSYLIRLTVNASLVDQQIDSVVAAVRQLKSRFRIPAAGETTQVDPSDGWAADVNPIFRFLDGTLSDPGEIVGANATGGSLTKGNVVRVTSGQTIKAGLPGQEIVPGFTLALATLGTNLDELLAVVECDVFGNTVGISPGALVRAHWLGGVPALALGGGAIGDPVFVSDTGTVSLTQGTARRQIGSITAISGSDRDVWIDGTGGGATAPLDRRYLVYGNPGALTNAFRVDGLNADQVINNTPFNIKCGDLTTITMTAQRFSALGADIFQWLTELGAVLSRVTAHGAIIGTPDGVSTDAMTGTGAAPNGRGQVGIGAGTGAGVAGTGGSSSGPGVAGAGGGPNGAGVQGQGTGTGAGISGTGGATSGDGVSGTGGSPNGVGVRAAGTGIGNGIEAVGGASSSAGIRGVGGVGGGVGVQGQGTVGAQGVYGIGGAPSGYGLIGEGSGTGGGALVTGGASSGLGVRGVGGPPNGHGVIGDGTGTGTGVTGNGGATNGHGVLGSGQGTGVGVGGTGGSSSGVGVSGQGGAPNGNGVEGLGTGTGTGVKGTNTAAGIGVDALNTSTGTALRATQSGAGLAAALIGNATRAPLNLAGSATPTTAVAGDIYYNSGTGKFQGFNGAVWQNFN